MAREDLARLEERHIADSLKALPLLREAPPGPCADVGSGAGFPGIPLAIAGPPRTWRLIEPRRQRAAFLEEVARTLELDVEVVVGTAEGVARLPRYRAAHGLTIARAVAPPAAALALLRPLTAPGGIAAAFLGAGTAPPPGAEVPVDGIAIVRVSDHVDRNGRSFPRIPSEGHHGEPGKS